MSTETRMADPLAVLSEACDHTMSGWDCGLPNELNAAYALLRIALGSMIFVHGYKKAFKGRKLKGTARWLHSMGMRPGRFHAWLAACTEMAIGVLLVLGLLTQFAAAGLIGIMVVAFWIVHRDKGFMITQEGWEYVVLIALMGLVTATVGPGDISVDAWVGIHRNLDGWNGLGIALSLGLGSGTSMLALFYRQPRTSKG